MKTFVQTYQKMESSLYIKDREIQLAHYFQQSDKQDRLWAIALFFQKRPKRIVTAKKLKKWAIEYSEIPPWLFEECFNIVGNLLETIAQIFPKSTNLNEHTLTDWMHVINRISNASEESQKNTIITAWTNISFAERLLFNKIITGNFRMSLPQKTIVNALVNVTNNNRTRIANSLLSNWSPETSNFETLFCTERSEEQLSKPYPFTTQVDLINDVQELGDASKWSAFYKWSNCTVQLIKREEKIFLWTEEELITEKFPEFLSCLKMNDDFVLVGELAILKHDQVLNEWHLQKRLSKKKPSKKLLIDFPTVLIVRDILELNTKKIELKTLQERHVKIESLLQNFDTTNAILLNQLLIFSDWQSLNSLRTDARPLNAQGISLVENKNGNHVNEYYFWKVAPIVIKLVLIYVERPRESFSGAIGNLTFASKVGENLVPITKALPELPREEIDEILSFTKANVIERFGPVQSILPELVFEICCDAIFASERHKSGVQLKAPRITRWLKEEVIENINSIESLKEHIS